MNTTTDTAAKINAATIIDALVASLRTHNILDHYPEIAAIADEATAQAADLLATSGLAIDISNDANIYAGQDARIVHVSTTGEGRKLYALKSRSTTIATAWDNPGGLREYAAGRLLNLPV